MVADWKQNNWLSAITEVTECMLMIIWLYMKDGHATHWFVAISFGALTSDSQQTAVCVHRTQQKKQAFNTDDQVHKLQVPNKYPIKQGKMEGIANH